MPEPEKAHTHTVLCQECGALIEVKDVDALLLSQHLAVCEEMVLLNGETD